MITISVSSFTHCSQLITVICFYVHAFRVKLSRYIPSISAPRNREAPVSCWFLLLDDYFWAYYSNIRHLANKRKIDKLRSLNINYVGKYPRRLRNRNRSPNTISSNLNILLIHSKSLCPSMYSEAQTHDMLHTMYRLLLICSTKNNFRSFHLFLMVIYF